MTTSENYQKLSESVVDPTISSLFGTQAWSWKTFMAGGAGTDFQMLPTSRFWDKLDKWKGEKYIK